MYAMGGEECYRGGERMDGDWALFAHQALAHHDFLVGARVSLFRVDVAALEELEERVVEQPHSHFAAGLHDAGEHERLAVADARSHSFRPEQDLEREHTP